MKYLLLMLAFASGAFAQDVWFTRVCKQSPETIAPVCAWTRVQHPLRVVQTSSGGFVLTSDSAQPTEARLEIKSVAYFEQDIKANRIQPLPPGVNEKNIVSVTHGGIALQKNGPNQVNNCPSCWAVRADSHLMISSGYMIENDVAHSFVVTYVSVENVPVAPPGG